MKPKGSTKDGKIEPKVKGEQESFEPCSHDDDGNGEDGDVMIMTRQP